MLFARCLQVQAEPHFFEDAIMMTFSKSIAAIVVAGLLGGGLAGCKKNEPIVEKGPAEQAGQKIDQAASKAGEEINKAASAVGKELEKAGEKIQDAAKEAQQKP